MDRGSKERKNFSCFQWFLIQFCPERFVWKTGGTFTRMIHKKYLCPEWFSDALELFSTNCSILSIQFPPRYSLGFLGFRFFSVFTTSWFPEYLSLSNSTTTSWGRRVATGRIFLWNFVPQLGHFCWIVFSDAFVHSNCFFQLCKRIYPND